MQPNLDSKTNDEFRTCLKKSEVLKPEVLEKWLTENPDQTPKEDATQLVRKNLLTEWQAKYLLSGRYRLHLGNYQLLERVRRDSFGDRFIALHPQLGRTVQVQVLPVELTDAEPQRTDFLKKASLAGELDHPNLAHVFDIDKQQGRYYLVTEHSPGQSLTELRSKPIKANEIARIVCDSIAGLKHAHQRSVVHENLSMDNVLVNKDGVVKVSQIALSPLAKKTSGMAKENVTPEQGDLLAIVRMGRRMLNDLPSSGTTRELTKLLSNLNTKDETDFTNSLIELENWAEKTPTKSTDKASTAKSKSDVAPMELVSDGEIERLTKNARLTEVQRTKSGDRQKETWQKFNGSSNLARNGVITVMLITLGMACHFGFQAIRKSAPTRPLSQSPAALQQKNGNVSLIGPDAAALLDSTGGTGSLADVARQSGDRTSAASALLLGTELPTPVVNPNAFQRKPDAKPKLNARQQRRQEKRLKKPLQQDTVPAATVPVDGWESTMKGESPAEDPVSATKAPKPKVSAKKPMPVTTVASAKTKPQADEPVKEEPAKPAEPFDGIPEFVDLPSTESLDEVVLAEIKQSSLHLLTMEIRSAVGIGKGKTSFDLKRDETTKRQWTLLEKKKPRGKGNAVGQFDFDKPSGQIKFHWLAEAGESRNANHVRNCVLKIKLGSSSRTMALRSPVALQGLKLTSEKPFAKLTAECPGLPSPELLSVELLPLEQAGSPKVWLDPAIGQLGDPLIIHFHQAASNRFMWLQLDTGIQNKKIESELKLMLKHADGTVQPISRSEDLDKLVVLLREASADALLEYDANKDIVAPQGKKTKFKEFVAKLKTKARVTQRQAEIAAENTTIVQSFYDRAIPFRITLRTDDYQIVLADSTR